MSNLFELDKCYLNQQGYTYTNDSILSYAILITTFNTYVWYKKEKPNKKSILLSYILSVFFRYSFYPLYMIGDTICLSSNLYNYLKENKIEIL